MDVEVPGEIDLGIEGLSNYREIGSGGFAAVFVALEECFSRDVAVKLLLDTVNNDGKRRFDRERGVMGRLGEHTNVVTAYRSGYTDAGRPYIVMEFLRGGSLQQVIDKGSTPAATATDWILQVAGAVHKAHSEGIVHRDIKPANILLTSDGIPKLTDFGIAAIREANTTQRSFTIAHSPPETFEESEQRDERSDLYSLASTLYTLIVGHTPFEAGALKAQIKRILHEPFAPTGQRALDEFFLTAMAKDPSERYQTTAQFIKALNKTSKVMDQAPPPPPPPPGRRPSKAKQPPQETWGSWLNKREPRFLGELTGHADWATGCAVAPDGNYIVSSGNDRELRIWNTFPGEALHILKGHDKGVFGCAIAPDSSYIVSASNDGRLRVWELESGTSISVLKGHTDGVFGCAIAPDNSYVVSASIDKTLRIWDPHSGDKLQLLEGHANGVFACAVAPDSSYIVSASRDRTLRMWDARFGTLLQTFQGHTRGVYGCAVAPDGSYIVSASTDRTVRIWDPPSGTLLHTMMGHTDGVFACAVSPDSSYIVTASTDKTLRIWDPRSGTLLHTLMGHTDGVFACAVSPDSSYIVTASTDKTLRIWSSPKMSDLVSH